MADEPEESVVVDLDKVDELRAKQGIVETVEPEGPKADQIEESIDTLRARVAAAEARASNAEARVQEARGVVRQSSVQEVVNAIEMLERENATLQPQIIAAQHAQDWDQSVPLQSKLTANITNIEQLKARKIAMENAPEPRQVQQVTQTPAEQLAGYMQQNGAPQSAAWVRAHPEYANDQRKYNEMLAAHHRAKANALAEETPEYFAFVERELGMGNSDQRRSGNGVTSGAAAASGGRQVAAVPPAAPPSRGGTGAGGSRGLRQATLTPDEARTARENKMTPEEYWLQKQQLIKEGKIVIN